MTLVENVTIEIFLLVKFASINRVTSDICGCCCFSTVIAVVVVVRLVTDVVIMKLVAVASLSQAER